MKLQLALQGGGAKFSALLAVAEAVQILQKRNGHDRIEVGRVSGTSAGAIVAAILAAGVDIPRLRGDLRAGEGADLVKAFEKPGQTTVLWRAWRGVPIWDTRPLRDWLTSVFQKKAKVRELVRDPKKPIRAIRDCEAIPELVIMASNLSDGIMHPCLGDHPIVSALMDSTALPFCFRTWKGDGNLLFDGGLGENLPVHQLSSEVAKYGEMVAVTFKQKPSPKVDGVLSFAGALLGFAIDSSVARACASLDKHRVLEVPTEIETLDFDKAVTYGLGDEYDRIRDWALESFEAISKRTRSDAVSRASVEPWSVEEPAMRRMMDDLAVVYQATHANRRLVYEELIIEATACSLLPYVGGETRLDRLHCRMRFSPHQEPVSCHAISVAGLGQREYHGRIGPCLRKSNGEKIECTLVPTFPSGPRIGVDERQMLLFFQEWLMPGQMYDLQFQDEGRDIMWKLQKDGHDELGIHLPRAHGEINRIVIILHVPDTDLWRNITAEESARSRPLTGLDQRECYPPGGFRTIGRVFENVRPTDACVVNFSNGRCA